VVKLYETFYGIKIIDIPGKHGIFTSMRKIGAFFLLSVFIQAQFLFAIPDYSRILPRPSLMVDNLVKKRAQQRQTNRFIANVVGGTIALLGIVTSDRAAATNLLLVGAGSLFSAYIWKDETPFETEGEKIATMPETGEVEFLEKQAMSANFILKVAEKEKQKRLPYTFGWATMGIFAAVEASPIAPFLFIGAYYVFSNETEEEITATQIKDAIGY